MNDYGMRAFATIGVGSPGSISIRHTMCSVAPELPRGIWTEAWVRIDENHGIVITLSHTVATAPLAELESGYFMVRDSGVWLRVPSRGAFVPAGRDKRCWKSRAAAAHIAGGTVMPGVSGMIANLNVSPRKTLRAPNDGH